MSSFRLVPVCILLFFSFDVGANAATTNVNAVIAARLAKKGIFHHTHDVYRRRPCVLCGDPRPITDRIRLRASNIRLSSTGGAIFGDAMFVDDPNPRDITYWVQYDDNCNPAGLKNSMTMILSKQIARMTNSYHHRPNCDSRGRHDWRIGRRTRTDYPKRINKLQRYRDPHKRALKFRDPN